MVSAGYLLEDLAGGALVFTVVGAGYTALAWWCQRRWSNVGLALLWFLAVLGTACWGFSRACAMSWCDLAGVDSQLRAMLAHALVAAVGLSPATLLVAHLARKHPTSRLGWRWTMLGGAGLVAGVLIVLWAYSAAARWTCDSQSFRRPDGSMGSACEVYESRPLIES